MPPTDNSPQSQCCMLQEGRGKAGRMGRGGRTGRLVSTWTYISLVCVASLWGWGTGDEGGGERGRACNQPLPPIPLSTHNQDFPSSVKLIHLLSKCAGKQTVNEIQYELEQKKIEDNMKENCVAIVGPYREIIHQKSYPNDKTLLHIHVELLHYQFGCEISSSTFYWQFHVLANLNFPYSQSEEKGREIRGGGGGDCRLSLPLPSTPPRSLSSPVPQTSEIPCELS